MKNKLIVILGFFFLVNSYAQNSDYYKKIDFENFVKNKTTDSYNYMKTIYRKLYYDSTQENEQDKEFNILLICDGNKKIDLIGIDSSDIFVNEIKTILKFVNEKYLVDDSEKYIVRIPIKVDFEPQEEFKWKTDMSEIHLFSYSIVKKSITIQCSFDKNGQHTGCEYKHSENKK